MSKHNHVNIYLSLWGVWVVTDFSEWLTLIHTQIDFPILSCHSQEKNSFTRGSCSSRQSAQKACNGDWNNFLLPDVLTQPCEKTNMQNTPAVWEETMPEHRPIQDTWQWCKPLWNRTTFHFYTATKKQWTGRLNQCMFYILRKSVVSTD